MRGGCLRKSGLVFELVSASIDALGFGGQALTLKSSGKLDLTTMAILEMSAESFGVFPLRTMRGRPVDHLQVMVQISTKKIERITDLDVEWAHKVDEIYEDVQQEDEIEDVQQEG